MVGGGIVLMLIGLGLLVAYGFQRRKLATLTVAKPRTAGELTQSAASIGQELGAGGFKELVELAGEIRCAQPLQSPLGGQRCVHFEMQVVREYEEDYEERDSKGNVRRGTRRGSETVASDTQSVEFQVADASGACDVAPGGASFDTLVQSVSRFEPGQGGAGGVISFGGFSLQLNLGGGRRRTLGYRYREEVLPVGRRVTVVGQVDDQSGRLTVRKGEDHFIISTRTKAELMGSAKTNAQILSILGGVGLFGGLILLVIGLIKG